MTEPTRETERQALIAQVGDCCGGADPFCAGGCLVEKAIRRRERSRPYLDVAKLIDRLLEVARESDRHLHGPVNRHGCSSRICVLLTALDRDYPGWKEWV